MELHEIENAVKTGVCPFTQKAYDCGKCDHNPRNTTPHGPMSLHFGLCITRPLHYGTKGWRDTLKYFERRDRDEAQKILSRLLQMGVEQIPVGSCDLDHFCFKHGCVGHTTENLKED